MKTSINVIEGLVEKFQTIIPGRVVRDFIRQLQSQ